MTILRPLALAGVLVLLLVAAGCTTPSAAPVTTSTDTPEPTTVATSRQTTIPTTVAPALAIKAHAVEHYTSTTEYQQPGRGYRFVLVDFSITNAGARNGYSYNPNDIKLRDPDNYQYGYHRVSYLIPGSFESTTIPLGETRRGKLVFEVPEKWGVGTVYQIAVEA